MSIEQLELLLKEATDNYSDLLNSISTTLNNDENFDIDTMDPFDYLYEQAPELAHKLIENFQLMNSYNEMLIEKEIEEKANDED